MRIKLLIERFINRRELQSHYYRHVIRDNARPYDARHGLIFGDITIEEYDQIAETLVKTPVDNKFVFGFAQRSSQPNIDRMSYCKYDASTKTFVSYYYLNSNKNIPIVYTCFKTQWDKYIGKQASVNEWEFVRELDVGE